MECPVCHEPCNVGPRGGFVGCPNGCDVALDDTGTPTEKICLTCPEFEDCVMACADYERWIAEQRAEVGRDLQGVGLADGPEPPEPSHFQRKRMPRETTTSFETRSDLPNTTKKKKTVRKPLIKIDGANIRSLETITTRLKTRLEQLTGDRKIPLENLEIPIVEKVN